MNTGKDKEFIILLVDDRPENNLLLQEVLEKENRRFITASSGNEALKIALKNPEIGLIMLDVQMPEMDGFEVARLLQSNSATKDIAIIFVTAIHRDEQYVLQGFSEGAVDYLQKPLDVNVTIAKVNVFEKLYIYQRDLKNSLLEIDKINKQLEKFTYIVSHDLKSPLASIITLLSSMRGDDYLESNPRLHERFDLVSIAAEHLSGMINSLLEYSKRSAEDQLVEDVDTYEIASQTAFLLFPPSNIRIHVAEHLPVVRGSKIKLQQVFQNLISNAIKYNDKAEGLIEIDAIERDDLFEFTVKDNGPGISENDVDRIFKLFEVADNRSNNNDTSSGIGLNILKVIIEEQGGKIWVDSERGKGSAFHFTWLK